MAFVKEAIARDKLITLLGLGATELSSYALGALLRQRSHTAKQLAHKIHANEVAAVLQQMGRPNILPIPYPQAATASYIRSLKQQQPYIRDALLNDPIIAAHLAKNPAHRKSIDNYGAVTYNPELTSSGIIAHELGHAREEQRWPMQQRGHWPNVAYVLNALAPVPAFLVGSMVGKRRPWLGPLAGMGTGLAAGYLTGAPELKEERLATAHAYRYLDANKQLSPVERDKQKDILRRAYDTYVYGNVLAPAVSGIGGGITGALLKNSSMLPTNLALLCLLTKQADKPDEPTKRKRLTGKEVQQKLQNAVGAAAGSVGLPFLAELAASKLLSGPELKGAHSHKMLAQYMGVDPSKVNITTPKGSIQPLFPDDETGHYFKLPDLSRGSLAQAYGQVAAQEAAPRFYDTLNSMRVFPEPAAAFLGSVGGAFGHPVLAAMGTLATMPQLLQHLYAAHLGGKGLVKYRQPYRNLARAGTYLEAYRPTLPLLAMSAMPATAYALRSLLGKLRQHKPAEKNHVGQTATT